MGAVVSERAPTGTVTFLFTDIVGSTQMWDSYPDEMSKALARHFEILQAAIGAHGGYLFKSVGDGCCIAFEDAVGAVKAAIEATSQLVAEHWPEVVPIRARMGLHTGVADCQGGDYFGQSLNRVARIMSAAHSCQILVSATTAELARPHLPHGVALIDQGFHQLKDLKLPERLYLLRHRHSAEDEVMLRTLRPRHNLPPQLSSFVGRDDLVRQIKAELVDAQLLTLVGPGGTGKTRAALKASSDMLSEYPEGVYFAELGKVRDPAFVPRAVAIVMGLPDTPGLNSTDQIAEYLGTQAALLILDNCEHVLSQVVPLASRIMQDCHNVRLVATSRQRLSLQGEKLIAVPPLAIPPTDAPADWRHWEALTLFVERAHSVAPGLSLDAANIAAIARICRHLDGSALAIELAAARANVLTVGQIEDRLTRRFQLLSKVGTQGRTLEQMIAWSYDLLSPDEQKLLRRLSMFSSPFSLEAAEALEGSDCIETLDRLTELTEKSLVFVDIGGQTARYRLLETVRAYAFDKLLQSAEIDEAKSRFVEFETTSAGQASESLWDDIPDDGRLEKLTEDVDNLRAAFILALESDSQQALSLGVAMGEFWRRKGFYAEGIHSLERALQGAVEAEHGLRARAHGNVAMLALYYSDMQRAESHGLAAIAEADKTGDEREMMRARVTWTWVVEELGEAGRTRAAVEDALTRARTCGSLYGLAMALPVHGQLLVGEGDLAAARKSFEEALAIGKRLANATLLSLALYHLAGLAAAEEDWETAYAFSQESVALADKSQTSSEIAHALEMRARSLIGNGRIEEARVDLANSAKRLIEAGEKVCLAHNLEAWARLALQRDDPGEASRLLCDSNSVLAELEMAMLPVERSLKSATESRLAAAGGGTESSTRKSRSVEEVVTFLTGQIIQVEESKNLSFGETNEQQNIRTDQ